MGIEAAHWHERRRDGVNLACLDFGGSGFPVLLLHGLAGHAREWSDMASWLAATNRVIAPDQRGHGRSDRHPVDVSREAFVEDAAMWVRELVGGSAIVVGQSLGGHTAFLLAAQRPELVKALVVAEASPQGDGNPATWIGEWLRSWPIPFPSRDAALAFFGGDSLWARAWVEGLRRERDGLWPSFDAEVMLSAIQAVSRSYWDDWAAIRCPTLIVRAAEGMRPETAQRMHEGVPGSRIEVVTGAEHDLHLDQPDAWRAAVSEFIATQST